MNAGLDVQRAYSNYVLRPITVAAALCGMYFLFHRSWRPAGMCLAASFLISVIGYDMAASEGVASERDESYLLAKGVARATVVFFLLAGITMLVHGIRWYFAIPGAWLLAFCASAVPAAIVAWIVGYLRRKTSQRSVVSALLQPFVI